MPIVERDPWRVQYFEGVACPDDVFVPTEDADCYRLYPAHRWVYNKLLVCDTQGLEHGPHGIAPERYPVFSKPIYNMRGMGTGGRIIASPEEYARAQAPGCMWMPLLAGEHVSTDAAVTGGEPRWWRHTVGKAGTAGTFDYWTVLAEHRPNLEAYAGAWICRHLRGYTGIVNFETIGGRIIECHLRMADQWVDLYGPGWVEALVELYAHRRWTFADAGRRTGYSVVLFGGHGVDHTRIDRGTVEEFLTRPGVSSIQTTFHDDRPAEAHAMPPGGFRLAIVNCWDLEAGLEIRERLALHFWSRQKLRAQWARPGDAPPASSRDELRVVDILPRPVREIEHCWIPLPDGCRLAARIWLPADAETSPVPAILEYIPYRKRDFTRARDEPMHRYFAGHGYAAVRVDLRGSGDSDGVLLDEYLPQEQDDALAVLRWIAAQAWCTGAIGMIGKSWGGLNALQVAARQPPELKAIVTVCSTDDRYADDAHYMGGCLLNENLIWGSVLLAFNALPPDPALVGERWRETWLARLEQAVLFPETWLRHQRRDAYWAHGSVCEDFERITCPVYAVGGWADGYTNAVPRLLAGLTGPRKGLVGPWGHLYPHEGVPRPAIGFLQESLRWWDHWLKGIDTGIMDEPMYRVWMQESVPPRPFYEERPGRWVAEPTWPSPRIATRRWVPNRGRLDDEAKPETRIDFRSPETAGLSAGDWCSFGAQGETPIDQRDDAGTSVIFDSAPLGERLEILGAPVLALALAVDRPHAFVAVRLNDVAPDGSSTRVTYGLLNLTHRASHEHPEPLEPGRRYDVRVRLNDIAHAFPPGHRVRVAVSTTYWPTAWPSAEPVTLAVFTGAGALELPVRAPHAVDDGLRPFGRPEGAPRVEHTMLRPARFQRTIERDLAADETVYTVFSEGGDFGAAGLSRIDAIDLEVGYSILKRFRIREHDPLSARAEVVQKTELGRRNWTTRVETHTRFSATLEAFHLQGELDAYEGRTRIFSLRWDRTVPRDLV